MTNVLAHRLRGFHALLEMALSEERARPRPDDRSIAGIKKRKLAIKDRLAVFDDRRTPPGSH
ncbi:DUF465 domain-containing protein [Rhizobium sp. CRIBSB]|nr:DUF465 domain-containing protein [Rhizobium sp. CRIBSB]